MRVLKTKNNKDKSGEEIRRFSYVSKYGILTVGASRNTIVRKRMKKLLVYLKGYYKESVLGPLFKLLEASLELIVPLVVAAIIDNGIGAAGGDRGYIVRMSLVLVALGLIGLIFSVLFRFTGQKQD